MSHTEIDIDYYPNELFGYPYADLMDELRVMINLLDKTEHTRDNTTIQKINKIHRAIRLILDEQMRRLIIQ